MLQRGSRVAVAMSGGIDSSISAWLLKEKGFDVTGVYMRNWDVQDEVSSGKCTGITDELDMINVCKHIGIKHVAVDFVKEYWNEVFIPFIDAYKGGYRTPNPDIACNKHIKFNYLKKFCNEKLGIHALATGHYAQLGTDSNGNPQLMTGVDKQKDQSYFLCNTPSSLLKNVYFPVGSMHKSEVKRLAAKALPGLSVTTKKESMGLCFIGKRNNFYSFLGNYLDHTPGNFVDIQTGQVVGQHKSKEWYTIGQKAKLSGNIDKYYVVKKAVNTSDIFVGMGKNHPALYCDKFYVHSGNVTWITGIPPPELVASREFQGKYKSRYNQPMESCVIRLVKKAGIDALEIASVAPARAITIGQIVAFYDSTGTICYGGAAIEEVGESYFQLKKQILT